MAKLAVGSLTTFNHENQDWSLYKDRLEQWFFANDIGVVDEKSGDKRRAILLSNFAEPTYKLVRDLALPETVGTLSYVKVIALLDSHFDTKKCGFAERFKFYSATQRFGEDLAEWAARVRGLATHCGFQAAALGEALRDRFVLGMGPGPERDKLFTQKMDDLTLTGALDIAEAVRCARMGSQLTASDAVPRDPLQVLKVYASPAQRPARRPAAAAPRGRAPGGVGSPAGGLDATSCSACGYANHQVESCKFTRYKCKVCGEKGHLKRMCPSKTVAGQHFIECCVDGGDNDDGKRIICNIRTYHGEPMRESVRVNEMELDFELDTGSAVTVISEQIYKQHFRQLTLKPSTTILQSYNGGKLLVLGVLTLPITYKNYCQDIDVHVIRGGGPPLLGRDFISRFNLQVASVNKCENILEEITSKYPNLFSGQLGCCKDITVNLTVKPQSQPTFRKARPIPFALRERVGKEIDRLVDLGILVPVKSSDYASPIVPVLKQNNSIRLCVDYSGTLNKQLVVEKYPLPRVDELFAKLHGAKYFSKLDLSQAYNQFQLNEASQMLTCINTHKGLFKYTRLVFGLSSAPAIFQRAMETILTGLEGVLVFLDDILVVSKSKNGNLNLLHKVFHRLEQAGLVLQKDKCSLFQTSVSYLGFVIDSCGIHKSPEKVKSILEAKVPSNVAELKSFLGLVNYYRMFIKNASSILSPLHNLLQKQVTWDWNAAHDKAVAAVKSALTSEHTLAHFNPDATLILTVDASPTGLGAILSQVQNGVEKPVAFMSRALSSAEKRYSQIQKEATAIIFGVRKFHQYLFGRAEPFILRTDHKPLLSIFNPDKGVPEITANRLQRYAIFLSAYNFTIEYVSSAHNSADYLSRAVNDRKCNSDGQNIPTDTATYIRFVCEGEELCSLDDLRRESRRDKILSLVINYVLSGWPNRVSETALKPYYNRRYELSVEEECLMWGHKIIVPLSLRNNVLSELHKGHFGVTKMKSEARDRVWWPGLSADVERRAAACAVCAAQRAAPPRAPLTPWPYPSRPWQRVHIDFLGPIHNRMFLIVVDAYSKWVECFDVTSGYGSRVVMDKLCEVMARFGLFNTICSDNGPSFISSEFKEFCSRNGIKHVTSPTYNPASNGQCEIYVKIIKKAFKSIMMTCTNVKEINMKLQDFLLRYRNSVHGTTNRSPSEVLFGKKLRCKLDLLKPTDLSTSDPTLDKIVKVKQCLQRSYYSGNRKVIFKVDDPVLVQIVTNQKKSWTRGVIVQKLGCALYLVRVKDSDILLKKHVNQLLKYRGREIGEDALNEEREEPGSQQEEEQLIPAFLFSTNEAQSRDNVAPTAEAGLPPTERQLAAVGCRDPAAAAPPEPGGARPAPAARASAEHWSDCEEAPPGCAPPRRERPKRIRNPIDFKKYF